MWPRQERAAGAAARRISTPGPATRAASGTGRYAPVGSAPALAEELIWGLGRWGSGRCWGPARASARPVFWRGLWGAGRWAYMLWGHRRLRAS